MTIPQTEGTKKEDHGKYLSVWRRVGKNWLLAADAWSSDLPPSTGHSDSVRPSHLFAERRRGLTERAPEEEEEAVGEESWS